MAERQSRHLDRVSRRAYAGCLPYHTHQTAPMPGLLTLPIELLRFAFYALRGVIDVLRARNRLRPEFSVLVNAPRETVWRLNTADHLGPPVMEIWYEPVPESADLWLTRLAISGQLRMQSVSRVLERDEMRGIIRSQFVAHTLSVPPVGGRDVESGLVVEATPAGTRLTG